MNVLAQARRWFWPDPRSSREIEGDIAEELAFHVDRATEDLVASGLERDEARARARAQFGDFERVSAACRREQLGGRIMLLRIQWIVIAVLASALILLGFHSVAAQRMALAQQERAMARAAELAEQLRVANTPAERTIDADAASDPRQRMEAAMSRFLAHGDPSADRAAKADPQAWLARFDQDPLNWRSGLALANELVETLEPAAAFEVMKAIYPQLSLEVREQVFKPFVFDGGHPFALQILKLGVNDESPSVRERAYSYLKDYAFIDFSEDPGACEAWFARYGSLPLETVIQTSAFQMVARLRQSTGESLAREMLTLSSVDFDAARNATHDLSSWLRDGLLPLVQTWVASNDTTQIAFGMRMAALLDLSEGDLRRQVLEPLQRHSAANASDVWSELCGLLGRPGNAWAVTPLTERLRMQLMAGERGSPQYVTAAALAEIGDANAIPCLIGLLRAEDSPEQRYALGYFALRDLTGISYDESHTAQWWVDWWNANSARFPTVGNKLVRDYGF